MAYTRKFGDEVAGLVFVDASHPDQVARFAEVANTPPDYINEAMQIASSLAWTGIIRLMATADGAHDVPVRVTEKAKAFVSTSLAAVVSENMNVDRTLGRPAVFARWVTVRWLCSRQWHHSAMTL